MWEFPASLLAEFFANHGMFGLSGRPNWLTVAGGSARYVEAITRPFARPPCASPRRCAASSATTDCVEVTPAGGEPSASTR